MTEALQGRERGSLARKQMVPATDEKAQKGSEARTDAHVSHGPEVGNTLYLVTKKGGVNGLGWKRQCEMGDWRKQGGAGHEGGRRRKGGGEQGHQESNLDPPSRDGGAPTPANGHHLDSFIVLCTMRILYGPYIYTVKFHTSNIRQFAGLAHIRSLEALAMSESKRSWSSAVSPDPMATAQKLVRPSSISATAVHVPVTTSYRSTTVDEAPSPPATKRHPPSTKVEVSYLKTDV
jgi:hypothetical protein